MIRTCWYLLLYLRQDLDVCSQMQSYTSKECSAQNKDSTSSWQLCCLSAIAAQSLSQHQSITYLLEFSFPLQFCPLFISRRSPVLEFLQTVPFPRKTAMVQVFCFVVCGLFFFSSQKFSSGIFPVFLRPPSIPTLWYIHNQYFISPLEKMTGLNSISPASK